MADTRIPDTEITKATILAPQYQYATQFTQPQIVQLSPATTYAKVMREGYQVPSVIIDLIKSKNFLDNLDPVSPKNEPRVVQQSVRPGTQVQRGTTVDLVMAPTSIIPVDIIKNPHKSVIGKFLIDIIEGILKDAVVRQTLLKYDDPSDVPDADKAALIAKFKDAKIDVDDAHADTSFAAAFNTARGALAFR